MSLNESYNEVQLPTRPRYSGFADIEYYEASEVPLGDENSGRDMGKSGEESVGESGGEYGEGGIRKRGGEESGQRRRKVNVNKARNQKKTEILKAITDYLLISFLISIVINILLWYFKFKAVNL